jgi:hypothetical protein
MSTWHHGLVAEWWSHFNTDGPEIDYYRNRIEEPVPDAGCGTGRCSCRGCARASTSTAVTRRPT